MSDRTGLGRSTLYAYMQDCPTGDRLVFWGGGINTQNTFPFGTEEDVRREAQECLDIFAPGGGCVVNPIHNIQADVPIENILALYEMARQYSY